MSVRHLTGSRRVGVHYRLGDALRGKPPGAVSPGAHLPLTGGPPGQHERVHGRAGVDDNGLSDQSRARRRRHGDHGHPAVFGGVFREGTGVLDDHVREGEDVCEETRS